MIWLLVLTLLTAIFTVGLTGKYKDEVIELKQELMDQDVEWQDELYKVTASMQIEIASLVEENERLRLRR